MKPLHKNAKGPRRIICYNRLILAISIHWIFGLTPTYSQEPTQESSRVNTAQISAQISRDIARANELERRGEAVEALTIWKSICSQLKRVYGGRSRVLASCIHKTGLLQYALRDYRAAVIANQEALAIRELSGPEGLLEASASLENLAASYEELGDYHRALEYIDRSMSILKTISDTEERIVRSSNSRAGILAKLNRTEDAERGYRDALVLAEQRLGREHMVTGLVLNDLGLHLDSRRKLTESVSLLRRALEIRSIAHGTASQEYATTLNNLASASESLGDTTSAIEAYRQVVAIRSDLVGAQAPETIQAINNLGYMYLKDNQLDKSESTLKKALNLSVKHHGDKSITGSTILINLGELARVKGEYNAAIEFTEKAISVYAANKQTMSGEYAIAINNLATLYKKTGELNKAESLLTESLSLTEKIHGDWHPEYATSQLNLALVYLEQGEHGKAMALCHRVLQSLRSSEDRYGLKTITALGSCGNTYHSAGNLPQAQQLLEEGLKLSMNRFGAESPSTAHIKHNLGLVLLDKDEFSKALELIRDSEITNTKLYGAEHILIATNKAEVASIHRRTGQFDKASALYKEALEIQMKRMGRFSRETLITQNNLITTYVEAGNIDAAMEQLGELTSVIRNAGGKIDPGIVATTMSTLAYLQGQLGNKDTSAEMYRQALELLEARSPGAKGQITSIKGNLAIAELDAEQTKSLSLLKEAAKGQKEIYGQNSVKSINAEMNLAFAELGAGNESGFINLSIGAFTNLIGIMQREVPLLPTSQRESFTELFDQYASGNLIGALALNGGAQGRKGALFVRLNRHGMLEEIEKRQSQLISLTTEQKSLADELFKINNQLGSLALDAEQRQKMVLRQSEVERDLYRLLPEITPRVVSVDQVALTLPRNSALIEFQKYQPYRHGHARNGRWQQAHYLALVLNADGLVSVYELGAANTIDQRIQQAVTASEQQLEDAENLWESVGELILSPLEHAIRGMETLFISPDAELNRLPFASLPDRSSDQLFGDVVKLRLLTTGRELLELGQPSAGPKNAALVVANPDFDQLPVEVAAIRTMQNRNKSGVGQQRSTDSETLHWSPLPATEKEGESIAKLTNARLLTQRHASASAVQSAEAPRMIHIASHAFFLADQSKTQKTATAIARSSQAGTDGLRTAAIQGENPLLRSGIALAGANRALQQTAASDDDGYLTALEVAQLDWKGTELVVISACESGRGDIRAGEGVYGLKRAIAVAGARSSLLSLWKVDDAATAAFMQNFYERLKAGTPRADALAATQKQFRQHPIPAWRHPYVWAAFQLSGDWRSIEW